MLGIPALKGGEDVNDQALLDEPDELTAEEILTEAAEDFGVRTDQLAVIGVEFSDQGSAITVTPGRGQKFVFCTDSGEQIGDAELLGRLDEVAGAALV